MGWTPLKICNFILRHPIAEHLRDLRRLFQCKSSNFCCINKPLLKIEFDNVVPDVLHLLLKVTVNVVQEVSEKNAVESFNEVERGNQSQNLPLRFTSKVPSLIPSKVDLNPALK